MNRVCVVLLTVPFNRKTARGGFSIEWLLPSDIKHLTFDEH